MQSPINLSAQDRINPENHAAVAAATARLVNHAVERRVQEVAAAEQVRLKVEARVWRWAIVATLCFILVGAAFTALSRLHYS
jgi:hypothetical protein